MRVMLVGAAGMLGADLRAAAPRGIDLLALTRAQLDARDESAVEAAVADARPDWIINAAAYTQVDLAESQPDAARAVNATAVAILAASCVRHGARFVHFSTDYVFSGDGSRPYRESDPVAPIGAYGRTKAEGEAAVVASGVSALVVRTQWLFGAHGRSFPRTMIERARAGAPTRVVNDQVGRPTYSADLAAWTWALVARNAVGVIHAANAGTATWYDVAERIFRRFGVADRLSPCATSDYPTAAVRPAFSVLDTTRLESTLGPVPHWHDALDRFLATQDAGVARD